MIRKVAIVGGGIIGLLTAYYLRKRGLDVVVLDRGRPGRACFAPASGRALTRLILEEKSETATDADAALFDPARFTHPEVNP